MWKVVSGAQEPPHSSCLLVTFTLVLLFYVAELPSSSHCMPYISGSGSSKGFATPSVVDITSTGPGVAQFQNLIREALKYMHKINSSGGTSGEPARISGQMNLRYPRSEIGDVAHRLSYLQEMDRKFGAKARPSGQMNLRYPRSEIGDVAHRLSYLQEMDRKFGAKARPRFGKRNEVTQDNFIPMYADDELRDSTNGANGDNQPSLLFIP